MNLESWRKHIDAVIADEGQILILADENGLPMWELPGLVTMGAPESHLDSGEVQAEIRAQEGSPVIDELVADGLGVADETGRIEPAQGPMRMLIVERAGHPRRAFFITHCVASGDSRPSNLTIHGVDLKDSLSFWPGVSIPLEVQKAEWEYWDTDASGEKYEKTRKLARVPLATKADGYTLRGPARSIIRDFIQDSFDAVNTLYGWEDDPHAVVDYGGGVDMSDDAFLRTTDDYVWDTVASTAKNRSISIKVDLWWPGDGRVVVRSSREPLEVEQRTWDRPILIVRVNTMREVD